MQFNLGEAVSFATVTSDQKAKIAEILKLLDQIPVPASIENRRGASRVRARMPIDVFLLTVRGVPTLTVHTRNISTRGIGFVSRRAFKMGELVVFDVNIVPAVAKLVLARITFARYVRDGLYEIGAEFEESVVRDDPDKPCPSNNLPAHWLETSEPHKAKAVAKE